VAPVVAGDAEEATAAATTADEERTPEA